MSYWWVFQGKTDAAEKLGGFLWAPQQNELGQTFHYWSSMERVRPGDIIFCVAGGRLTAVALAQRMAEIREKPDNFSKDWQGEGWFLPVVYAPLTPPLSQRSIVEETEGLLQVKYGPINRVGTGVQGYLFAVPDAAGEIIMTMIGRAAPAAAPDPVESAIINTRSLTETERQALVRARIGQGLFRDNVLRHWSEKCCVSSMRIKALLRASHIKTWAASSNDERLDPHNGLLLAPNLDAAFDRGFISFADDGAVVFSQAVSGKELALLGITSESRISRPLSEKTRAFLAWHRTVILKRRRPQG